MKIPSPHKKCWGSGQNTSLPPWVVWITAVTGMFRAPIHLQARLPSSCLSGQGTDPCCGRGSRLWAPCGPEHSLWASAFNKHQVPEPLFLSGLLLSISRQPTSGSHWVWDMVSYLSTHLPRDGVCPEAVGVMYTWVLFYCVLHCPVSGSSFPGKSNSRKSLGGGLSQIPPPAVLSIATCFLVLLHQSTPLQSGTLISALNIYCVFF